MRKLIPVILSLLLTACADSGDKKNRGEPYQLRLPDISSTNFIHVLNQEIEKTLDSVLREEEEYTIFHAVKSVKEVGQLDRFVQSAWDYEHAEHDNLLSALFNQWDEDYRSDPDFWREEYRKKYQEEPPRFRTDTTILYDFFEMLLIGRDVTPTMADILFKAKGFKSADGELLMNDDRKMACFSLVLGNPADLSNAVREEMKAVFSTDFTMASNKRINLGVALQLLDTTSESYEKQVMNNLKNKALKRFSVEEIIQDELVYFVVTNNSDSTFQSLISETILISPSKRKVVVDTTFAKSSTLYPFEYRDEYFLEPGRSIKILKQAVKDTSRFSVEFKLIGGEFKQ